MTRDVKSDASVFNHNTAWQSQSVAEHYDARRFTSVGGRVYDSMEKRAIASCLRAAQALSPVKSVLDLACGTGRISEFLATSGYRLTCGDISEEMLAVAKQRLLSAGVDGTSFLKVDIYATGQAAGSFDCVTAFRLFQHLTSDERARALREMARLSRRFVLVNVMFTSPYYEVIRTLRRALRRYTTRYTSTQHQIDTEMQLAGLRIVESCFTQPGFNGDRVLLMEKIAQGQ
jgi:ubiquinone/menaquinone biosynthesis C-methylase UbiE